MNYYFTVCRNLAEDEIVVFLISSSSQNFILKYFIHVFTEYIATDGDFNRSVVKATCCL